MKERQSKGLMTDGPIGKQIILFALPLLLGNLFQQLYNTVDSIVVGNYIGKEALAAVGSSGSLIQMIISTFMGLSVGASVVVSQCFGAEDDEGTQKAVHTAVAVGVLSGIACTILGLALAKPILRWIGTPESVMSESMTYFRIYFAGVISVVLYNVLGAILRAVGDSKSPLYFLIVASLLNIVLDLVFVAWCGWGVMGVALGTVISQTVSAVLEMIVLCRAKTNYRLYLGRIRLHRDMLPRIIRIGLPSALQNTVVSFSNLVVQSNINAFGDLAMAGCGAYNKIDGIAIMPAMSFSMAATTFVGQNHGARKYDRIRKGSRFAVLAGTVISEVIGVVVMVFAPRLIAIFNNDPDVIRYGTLMARTIAPFYFMLAGTHTMAGALRGVGLAKVPMISFISFWCVLRVLWITAIIRFVPDIRVVFFAYPVTWSASAIFLFIYRKRKNWVYYRDPEETAENLS